MARTRILLLQALLAVLFVLICINLRASPSGPPPRPPVMRATELSPAAIYEANVKARVFPAPLNATMSSRFRRSSGVTARDASDHTRTQPRSVPEPGVRHVRRVLDVEPPSQQRVGGKAAPESESRARLIRSAPLLTERAVAAEEPRTTAVASKRAGTIEHEASRDAGPKLTNLHAPSSLQSTLQQHSQAGRSHTEGSSTPPLRAKKTGEGVAHGSRTTGIPDRPALPAERSSRRGGGDVSAADGLATRSGAVAMGATPTRPRVASRAAGAEAAQQRPLGGDASGKAAAPAPAAWFRLGERNTAVHLVATRFSLGQGGFESLVEARLALFRTICFPSVAAQTDQRFVWIIYVDSTLPNHARQELESLSQSMPNAAVVRLRKHEAVSVYESPARSQIKTAQRWREPPNDERRLFFSTRLDADDALPLQTIEKIHEKANARLAAEAARVELFFCALHAMTWMPSAVAARGLLAEEHASSHWSECLTPGLTLLTSDPSSSSIHGFDHTMMRKGRRRRELIVMGSSGGRWSGPLRARTVTSDGLKDVRSAREAHAAKGMGGTVPRDAREDARLLRDTYGIEPAKLKEANGLLVAQEQAIAHERTTGHSCVNDFSCKTKHEARQRLEKLAGGKQL
uniref:Hexosyltransferase n=1 Tax=Calcidiscus leptoporus TaxID=127549 RepID=A0A7S0P3M7_9EUKA|mmetsp:Transcript_57597/g.132279  ORF Transcript_57597/g.132279 Transcript_57597/m.132279 type:complete len:630 (+) Transcript_57597:154-2043(+)